MFHIRVILIQFAILSLQSLYFKGNILEVSIVSIDKIVDLSQLRKFTNAIAF